MEARKEIKNEDKSSTGKATTTTKPPTSEKVEREKVIVSFAPFAVDAAHGDC